jgi:diaminopimelate epimerase
MELLKSHGSRNEIFVAPVRPCDLAAADFVRAVCSRDAWTGGGDGVYFYDGDEAWFFNPDGSAAEFCGNGMRLLGRELLDTRGTDSQTITSGSSTYTVRRAPSVSGVRQVAVEMPALTFITTVPHPFEDFTSVQVPNPHVVAVVDKYSEEDLVSYGLSAVTAFPQGANVSFLLPLSAPDEVFVRTFERGAGLTPSCGSGAVASRAVYSRVAGVAPSLPVLVRNAGGVARSWISVRDGAWHPVLEGNATEIFRASVDSSGAMLTPPVFAADEEAAYAAVESSNRAALPDGIGD